ncbi:peptidase inhibitor family I36 protein [Plantactinospora sp. CA-294935]|uniref:peptidase inhibitor family I36 protein n=1 Tax=Plantactinospora sp. CA-294935 TaxID=3240012 RepID=UPI003D8CEF08
MRRPRSIVLAAAMAAGLVGAVIPGVANAGLTSDAAAAVDCPFTNTVCLFEGTNYSGTRFTVSVPGPSQACVSLVDHGWGDRARSAYNTGSQSAALFANDDCVGGPYQLAGNTGIPDLGSFSPESVWVP